MHRISERWAGLSKEDIDKILSVFDDDLAFLVCNSYASLAFEAGRKLLDLAVSDREYEYQSRWPRLEV